ncbi:hypothetical protein SKAU_G00104410 [Synaphobranchus kaupii]|uniref:Uncharacterized protein n=1 Tax=Synaphobranchus kaupii TaxID=118154 RepID=A0A9Q1J7S6_SYNKA|nr:hypothetical protein SKAU_G00104410 [Synaphobranchus kaupii]
MPSIAPTVPIRNIGTSVGTRLGPLWRAGGVYAAESHLSDALRGGERAGAAQAKAARPRMSDEVNVNTRQPGEKVSARVDPFRPGRVSSARRPALIATRSERALLPCPGGRGGMDHPAKNNGTNL